MANKTTQVYRLQSAKHGLTQDFLSGKGSAIAGGRWNPVGVPLIYTSLSAELAALEILVHYFEGISALKLPPYLLGTFELPNQEIIILEPEDLPAQWRASHPPREIQLFTKSWLVEKKFLAMKLPSTVHSVATPLSYNILIDPRNPRLQEYFLVKIEPFAFDERFAKNPLKGNEMENLIDEILGR